MSPGRPAALKAWYLPIGLHVTLLSNNRDVIGLLVDFGVILGGSGCVFGDFFECCFWSEFWELTSAVKRGGRRHGRRPFQFGTLESINSGTPPLSSAPGLNLHATCTPATGALHTAQTPLYPKDSSRQARQKVRPHGEVPPEDPQLKLTNHAVGCPHKKGVLRMQKKQRFDLINSKSYF